MQIKSIHTECKNSDKQTAESALRDAACSPLSAGDLMDMAIHGKSIPADRVLATFAEESNWVQIYHGETSPAIDYEAKACEWAFIGPSRPPYELAQWALKFMMENVRCAPTGAIERKMM